MPEFIKNFFRRRKLAKCSSKVPTGLMPPPKSATVNVVIDVEEQGFDTLKEKIMAWGRQSGLKVCIYFFDFRKLSKGELLLTSIQTTITRKDLNWYGMPSRENIASLLDEPSDLFISLVDNGDFPIEFLSKCTQARFKIGRHAFPSHCYDMVISGKRESETETDSAEVFDKIVEFLGKISK